MAPNSKDTTTTTKSKVKGNSTGQMETCMKAISRTTSDKAKEP